MSEWQRLRGAAQRLRDLVPQLKTRADRNRALREQSERLLSGPTADRIRRSPQTERLVGRLHRAATGIADIASEVSAYADLLEEKTGELEAKRKKATASDEPAASEAASEQGPGERPPSGRTAFAPPSTS